jgi:hypothetical protein
MSEAILLESVPQYPDFDINGVVRTADELGLQINDFVTYSQDAQNKFNCSIVDDSTGTVRRFKLLKLQQPYNSEAISYGASWYKLDTSSKNVLEDSLKYDYKSYYDVSNGNSLIYPYLYEIFTELSLKNAVNLHNLPYGSQGGSWSYNHANGILAFAAFSNLAQQNIYNGIYVINETNKPVINVYKYIGRKNISNLTNQITSIVGSYNNTLELLLTYISNQTRSIYRLEELITNNTNASLSNINKALFTSNTILTTTSETQDLSATLFSTINVGNNRSVIVDVNFSLYCSCAYNERITIELWRDASMIVQSRDLGSINATGGITLPYSLTYLDENLSEGLKVYYIKYKLENNASSNEQGIINVTTTEIIGSSNIILREIANTSKYSNKALFENSNFTTTTSAMQDLSAILYNTIDVFDSNVQVNINLNLYCCYGFNERITVEVWRDASMIAQSNELGTINATGGLTIPYNFNYLDKNLVNGPKKYYLKYKLENNLYNQEQGIINLNSPYSPGSGNILLANVSNATSNSLNISVGDSLSLININTTVITTENNSFTTNTSLLQDLSASLYNTIDIYNNSPVLVDVNFTLLSCYSFEERITIELWRDLTMISRNSNIGTTNATGGFRSNYRLSFLDETASNGTNKYYIKYKLENNASAQEQGITNINITLLSGSSNILLRKL